MSINLKKQMEEFYTWMYTQDLEGPEEDSISVAQDRLRKAFDLLSGITDDFTNLSEEDLAIRTSHLNVNDFRTILELFRYLTNTSRINFKISFIIWLYQHNVIGFSLRRYIHRGSTKFSLQIRTGSDIRPQPSYEKLVEMITGSASIARECVSFFMERGLMKDISRIAELRKYDGLPVFLSLASIYQERGALAARRGNAAEEYIRNRLFLWGAIPEIHFNLRDVPLVQVLERKLHHISSKSSTDLSRYEEEIKKITSSRELDLIIPVSDPRLLIQCVFYTSDTGGIAHSTVNQNLLTRRHIDSSLPNRKEYIEFLGFADGPGWAYLVTDLRKTINGFDDFFQIKSIDSKLRMKLRIWRILLPIDVEEAILSISRGSTEASLAPVVQEICDLFGLVKQEVLQQLELFSLHGKIILKADRVGFHAKRLSIVRQYYVLDRILSLKFDKFAKGKDVRHVDTPLGPRTINVSELTNELHGIVNGDELNQVLAAFFANGSISLLKSSSL